MNAPKLHTCTISLPDRNNNQRITAPVWGERVKHATSFPPTSRSYSNEKKPYASFLKVKHLRKNTHLKKWILKMVCSGYCWENAHFVLSGQNPKQFHSSLKVMLHESSLQAPFGQDLVSELFQNETTSHTNHQTDWWSINHNEKFNSLQLHSILSG